ncbi:MAG: helix-hairpin-helix domain-containing protein [Candidatus Goldbacteria bacterium]|nr:helix-hairpin-helix domain-containing protein [Candidatus Goldiibacteriota bacterium]
MLTKEERTILLIIFIAFIIGIFTYFFTSYNKNIKKEIISDGKININTASVEELDKLPGIGIIIAKRIIEYREKNKKFKKIEEIKNIKGITSKKFEKIKNYIEIEQR